MDNTKNRFFSVAVTSAFLTILILAGYYVNNRDQLRLSSPKAPEYNTTSGLGISFAGRDFSQVKSGRLRNLHNGEDSYLQEANDLQKIYDFLRSLSGSDGESSIGHYEGTYSLELYANASAVQAVLEQEVPLFSIAFGDTSVFFYGELQNGYPIRFQLQGQSIEAVTEFFTSYDQHPILPKKSTESTVSQEATS